MEGDSDEGSDYGTDSNAKWLLAALDRGQAVQASIENNEIHHKFIAD